MPVSLPLQEQDLTETDLIPLFENPNAAYRGKPFWAWNGRLQETELIRQIHVLQRMGMGGFFMHSRTGLATEYLGPEWFRLINVCADEGERLGMEAWLYDEDRWPSGSAGGLVTKEPQFRMRSLQMDESAPGSFRWTDEIVAAFVCDREGLTLRSYRRLQPGETPAAGEGSVLLFRVVLQKPSSNYNGFTYVDTMNANATARYLELTHERYARECGSRLGRSIPGIFTDEPHRGALMDPFSGQGPEASRQAPWTGDLPEVFRKAFGYDLLDRLPEIFLVPEGRPLSQVKWHYVEILMRLFLERFAAPYARWCREHGLAVTGHVLHEDCLTAQTSMCGSVMRYYPYMDVPGIDLLTEGNRAYWVAKQLQSAGAQLGRPWLLSELYGCTGWQMCFAGHKAVGDWQALFGINLRCHHLCWYTMEGEAKRDYPASIFHQSAWWPLYRFVEDYFSRLGVILSHGRRVCRLLVVHPVESVWAQVHVGWARGLSPASDRIKAVEERFARLFYWLQGAQIDFDYADEGMLAEMGGVEPDGRIRVGEAVYDAALVGGLETIRSTTLNFLRGMLQSGGRVVFAGTPPAYVDALPSDAAGRLAQKAVQVPEERDAVVAACVDAVGRDVEVVTEPEPAQAASVFCQVRKDDEGRTIVALLNTDREHGIAKARIRIRAAGEVQEWDCWRGARHRVDAAAHGDGVEIATHFEPGGEHVYVVGPADPTLTPATSASPGRAVELKGPFDYRLSEPNVCVLDRCTFRVNGGAWRGPIDVLKADRQVRAEFGLEPRSGEMLQPWFVARTPAEPLGEVEVRFTFHVEEMPEEDPVLIIERPDAFTATLNGVELGPADPPRPWVDICFTALAVPGRVLRSGENEVIVRCRYNRDVGLEALYLLGSFGVRVDGARSIITKLPAKLEVGDVTTQGLPFYGGVIAYRLPVPEGASPARLRTPGMSAACAAVASPEEPLTDTSSLDVAGAWSPPSPDRVLAWWPYEASVSDLARPGDAIELRVYLTRRNTFGPLHQIPLLAPGYGPWNWLTEGDAYSDSYILLPSGLLEPPQLLYDGE